VILLELSTRIGNRADPTQLDYNNEETSVSGELIQIESKESAAEFAFLFI